MVNVLPNGLRNKLNLIVDMFNVMNLRTRPASSRRTSPASAR